MDDTTLRTLVGGLLSGGASAVTGSLAVLRDLKKKLAAVEVLSAENRTAIQALSEEFRRLRRELELWPEIPPDWLLKIVARASRQSSAGLRIEDRLEELEASARECSNDLARIREELANAVGTLRGLTTALQRGIHK